jgi:putative endonuclease
MGHVPQDPIHSDSEGAQFQRRQRRGTSLTGHHHSRSAVDTSRVSRARWAEERAAQWYEQQGFVVLAKNWTIRGGELDVVARRGGLLVICEVKARANNNFGSALEAMTDEKIRRVRRTGFQFLRSLEQSGLTVRFDVATVTGVHLEIFEDAF